MFLPSTMTDQTRALLARIPEGRMITIRMIELALRTGLSFDKAAAKARVGKSTATGWAAQLHIRKSDLAAETPEARRTRHERWALALASLGRMDEAAAWEAETRKLETTFERIGKRSAVVEPEKDVMEPARQFLGRVAETLGEEVSYSTAWRAVFEYYNALARSGAVLRGDGQVEWQGPVPDGLPQTPAWLPCAPWQAADDAAWQREAGEALSML